MKKLILIFCIIPCYLYSQEGAIGLKNNGEISQDSNKKSETITTDDNIKREPILPNSVYIGELGDFNEFNQNRVEVLKVIDSFFKDIEFKIESDHISDQFKFIFNNVYSEILLDPDRRLENWNIGLPNIDDETAYAEIEIYIENELYVGDIYVDYISGRWFINDLQIEIKEREIFDPSSPIL